MDRGTRDRFALALIAVLVLSGGVVFLLGGSSLREPQPPAEATAVVGVIVGVRSQRLDHVSGFDLRTIDQGTLSFTLDELENGAQFPPGHLVEHQATAQTVRVWYRTVGRAKVAIRLEDAPP